MHWVQDCQFALRMMRKQPWFTLAIVVTLALGIGVNTTVFTLVNAVLFKPLPFPGGERLVMLRGAERMQGRDSEPLSYPNFRDARQQLKSFEALEAIYGESVSLSEKGNPPERYSGARISAGLFPMLHVQPVLGRGFTPDDQKPGAAGKALIGYGVWKDRYGKDTSVVGREVRINDKPSTIVGVMPEGFRFPNNEDLWVSLSPDASWEKRTERRLMPMGILREGVSLPEARAEAAVIGDRLRKEYPQDNKDFTLNVRTFHEVFNGGSIRRIFLLMLGAVGFVLLIACANVANMLLSRAAGRQREMSIRSALGAGRRQLIRQVLVESVLMAVMGGVLGLLLAHWGVAGFSAAVANVGKPYWIQFTFNYVVLGYFAAVCLTAGMLFGLLPALQISNLGLMEALREGSRGTGTRRSGRASGVLVVFQFSLALVLMAGAGLMMRSFLQHQNMNRGYENRDLMHARMSLPAAKYKKPEDRQRFYAALVERLRGVSDVASAAVASSAPGNGGAGWMLDVEGRESTGPNQKRPAVTGVVVSPGYLPTLGLPLLRGRDFVDTDGMTGKEAIIASRKMVAQLWPNGDAIGKRVRIHRERQPAGPWLSVVGISPDIIQDNFKEDADPVMFVPHRQDSWGGLSIIVKAAPGKMAGLGLQVRKAVQSMDEDIPLFQVMPLAELIQRQRWQWRVFGSLFLAFAAIAAALSAVGIYAVLSQSAARRTREIGVRMALGARSSDVVRMVMRRGVVQLAIALALGLSAAFGVTRLLQGILYGVNPADPLTFAAVSLSLAAAGLVACWLPARRAARLDPVTALRDE
ncbi:MAG: ABC transporter permease [Acidobacteria bacterium]|nr:ABC transporter permease [Acidobacteriota bacterium]